MLILLGFLLLVAALLSEMFGAGEAEPRTQMCPSCGIRRLDAVYEGANTYYECTLCRKRYKRGVDGVLVRA
jgi:hypothetical protein